LAILQEK